MQYNKWKINRKETSEKIQANSMMMTSIKLTEPKARTELHFPPFFLRLNPGSSRLACKNLFRIKFESCLSPSIHCQCQYAMQV